MKIQGSVALIIGARQGIGSALARALYDRGAARVYRSASKARRQGDVNVLVHCLAVRPLQAAQPIGPGRPSPAGRALALIEELAPMLAAQGGGAVVKVICVDDADPSTPALEPHLDEIGHHSADAVLSVELRDRLAAQGTRLIHFRAQTALGRTDPVCDEQRALDRHLAMRILDRLETSGPRHAGR